MKEKARWLIVILVVALAMSGCVADGPIERGEEGASQGDREGDSSSQEEGDQEVGGDLEDGDGESPGGGDEEVEPGDFEAGDLEGDDDEVEPGDDEVEPEEPEPEPEPEEPGVVGDTCETAFDVTAGGVWIGESTVEMSDAYSPSLGASGCPGTNFSDRERVYFVLPGETTTYEVRAEPEAGFDLMIYVRLDCEASICVGGTRLNGAGVTETLIFEAPGGVASYIFVDGEIGHSGSFDLMVVALD